MQTNIWQGRIKKGYSWVKYKQN